MTRLNRSLLRCLAALVALTLAACGSMAPSGFSGDADVLLARGAAYGDYLARRAPALLSEEEVLALGYLERARLGLGSPFRLIAYAQRDPDLSDEMRERVAYALLARVLGGDTYQIDPVVLSGTRFFGVSPSRPSARHQMELIERTIAAAPTPTSGERAVRLGYLLANAATTVEEVPHSVVAQVAALVADRRRAQEDARALLRAAARATDDPLLMLHRWRRDRLLRVERAALTPLALREEVAISRDAAQVAGALRALAIRLSAPTSLVDEAPRGHEASVLRPLAAERLMELAEQRDYPAQAPVAVAIFIARDPLLDHPQLLPWERIARERFAESAWNEERLISGGAMLRAAGAGWGVRLPLTELQAAIYLRGWNQEEPWYPGDPAPAAHDVEGRFGLAGVAFDAAVPESWRPYYLRMLAQGLGELQRVLPTASLRGLRIRFGPLPSGVRALALHDPRTRTLHLPPATGAGTLAHEIAHDLDWQLARRRYSTRGGYATDLAVRYQRGDRLALSVSGLADAIRRPPGPDSLVNPHDVRPAEVFARGTDWFVAAALAREGRTGGYLTSFQDPGLTGYGTTRGPDVGGGAAPALLAILDGIAPATDSVRAWALDTYGPTRTLAPTELATAILSAGADLPADRRLVAIERASERSLASLGAAACRLGTTAAMRALLTTQRTLIRNSAEAAARGAAIQAIRELAEEHVGAYAAPRVNRWLAWRLHGAPEPVDSAVADLAPAFEDLLYRAENLSRDASSLTPPSAFRAGAETGICGANPFAAPPAPHTLQLLAAPFGTRAWPGPAVGSGVEGAGTLR